MWSRCLGAIVAFRSLKESTLAERKATINGDNYLSFMGGTPMLLLQGLQDHWGHSFV